ncbi:hypothetical protein Pryu01_01896 [Paraliobacillus ryukyuensis]|uniref:Transposase n=1 Tax=Paraliobacillus ryukyuensis TaxID=200904 RepID=A0A366DVA7_9BACI|nr:hypothetical protein [Paraliobacillus ryukyuensis]RBO93138.1 hypothetical protein DES48_1134 [Paraliobacillus ryukyuensis]
MARASCYKWLNRIPTDDDKLNKTLLEEMENLHQKVNAIYVGRRMTMNMNRQFDPSLITNVFIVL